MQSICNYDKQIPIIEKELGTDVDWNSVKIFLAIVNQGTLAAAAKSLAISNSTVYRRLDDFETKLGRLFDRDNGLCELTELGQQLLVQARAIENAFDDIERHLAGRDIRPQGVVKLTAPSSFSYRHLPRHLAAFNQLYPQIQIELLVTNSELNMTNRQADVALRVTHSPPEHLVGREICKIKWGVYASDDYLAQHPAVTDMDSLSQQQLIAAAGNLKQYPAFSYLERKYPDKIVQRSDDLIAMAMLAQSGNGLAFLPDDLAVSGLRRLFDYSVASDNALWILTHADLRKVQRISILMNYLAAALK